METSTSDKSNLSLARMVIEPEKGLIRGILQDYNSGLMKFIPVFKRLAIEPFVTYLTTFRTFSLLMRDETIAPAWQYSSPKSVKINF